MKHRKEQDQYLDGNEPWIEQRADPYVYKHTDRNYYFTASVPEYDRIILRRSKSLKGLANAKEVVIWRKHDTGIMGAHIWAPELHYLDGAWYIYFAAGEKEDIWKIRPYILECKDEDPLTGTWVERGQMQASEEDTLSFTNFSLDATVFEHQNKRYFVWAEYFKMNDKNVSNLYIAEMESPCQLKTSRVLLTTPEYDWENVGFSVNEGPAIIKRNNKIFLTYSASATGACYCMGMLAVDQEADLLDPQSWKKSRYPVLTTDGEVGVFGPGHNSFTTDEEGQDILVYHARPYEEIIGNPLYDPNRHAMLMVIKWNEEGIPVFDYYSSI